MSSLFINRSVPFRRGDFIISVFVDDKKAGTLLSGDELELELYPGVHQIQARCLGMRGKELSLTLTETEQHMLQVTVIRPNGKIYFPAFVFYILISAMPSILFRHLPDMLATSLLALIYVVAPVWAFISFRGRKKDWLKFESVPVGAASADSLPVANVH